MADIVEIQKLKPGRKPKHVSIDDEASAISICWKALNSLPNKEDQMRVIEYLQDRLHLTDAP